MTGPCARRPEGIEPCSCDETIESLRFSSLDEDVVDDIAAVIAAECALREWRRRRSAPDEITTARLRRSLQRRPCRAGAGDGPGRRLTDSPWCS